MSATALSTKTKGCLKWSRVKKITSTFKSLKRFSGKWRLTEEEQKAAVLGPVGKILNPIVFHERCTNLFIILIPSITYLEAGRKAACATSILYDLWREFLPFDLYEVITLQTNELLATEKILFLRIGNYLEPNGSCNEIKLQFCLQ